MLELQLYLSYQYCSMGIIRPYRNREEVYCGRLVVFHNSPNSWKLSKSIPGTDNHGISGHS